MVMIKCPRTGGHVFTGIETDGTSFERMPNASARLHCPLCGDEHAWRKSEAMLVESPSAPRS
jgi:hypothetical protein